MSVLVEQQDETINVIETQAAGVEKDKEVGYVFSMSLMRFQLKWLCTLVLDTQKRP